MPYGTIKADKITYEASGSDTEANVSDLVNKASLTSPEFDGIPKAPTAAADTNTTQIATTAYVQTELGGLLADDQTWTGAQRGGITALTDASEIAVDFNAGNNFSVTLAGNRTLKNPTNQVAGQSGSIFITQDGTGSRTLEYGNDWDFAAGTAPTISSAANAVDRIDYVVAEVSKIHAVATLDVK